ncbi:MAG: hypothetical protein QXI37_01400, partial [Thermoprotei archaeon]
LGYVLSLFYANLIVMAISMVPIAGVAFTVYIEAKLGFYENYIVRNHFPSLLFTGYQIMQPSFWLEMSGFALASSATAFAVLSWSSPTKLRLAWVAIGAAVSVLLLFAAALLEAQTILSLVH